MSSDTLPCPANTASDPGVPESDAELLGRFVAERTESAFEELMRRHGPMVMGVCRRILPQRHQAEDAYQTTFLLLVQKSAAIRRPEQLANWLFGVAYRVAARIRAKAGKQEILPPALLEAPAGDHAVEVERRELQLVLDEELDRLPVKYRLPLILCYLQGKTHVEAARELGWPSGSMSSRLTQAREKLRRRLARRGLTITSALFLMLLREQAYGGEVSATLIEHTARAGTACAGGKSLANVASARVAGLLAEMNQRMFIAKVGQAVALALLLLLLLGSACNAVRTVQAELKERAERRGATIPPPLTVQSGQPEVFALARPRSGASIEVGADAAAAPAASASSCSSQH
jgi:RNA polymerase sigma factor (sigma-70 family)